MGFRNPAPAIDLAARAAAADALSAAEQALAGLQHVVVGNEDMPGALLVLETALVNGDPATPRYTARFQADELDIGADRVLPFISKHSTDRATMTLGSEDTGQEVYEFDTGRWYWWNGGAWRERAPGDEKTGDAYNPPAPPTTPAMTGTVPWRTLGRLCTVSISVNWSGSWGTSFQVGTLPAAARPLLEEPIAGWWNGYVPGFARITTGGVITIEQAAATARTSFRATKTYAVAA